MGFFEPNPFVFLKEFLKGFLKDLVENSIFSISATTNSIPLRFFFHPSITICFIHVLGALRRHSEALGEFKTKKKIEKVSTLILDQYQLPWEPL